MNSSDRGRPGDASREEIRSTTARAALAAAIALAAACGDDAGGADRIGTTAIATPAAAAVATERAVDQATGAAPATPAPSEAGAERPARTTGAKPSEITPDLFIPSDDNRDPFEAYRPVRAQAPVASPDTPAVVQLSPTDVLFPDREVKDLQCRMILAMQGEKPRAYLLGPDGKTGYAMQGEYVGRPFYAGNPRREVYWQVYEIIRGLNSGVTIEAGAAAGREGDADSREARWLYADEDMARFENLFSLR